MGDRFTIPIPERLESRPEFPPITMPQLVDQEPVDWPEPEGFQHFASDPLNELISADEIDQATKMVFSDPRVSDALSGDRPIGLAPTVIEPKQPEDVPLLVYLLFSCATSNTIEVTVDVTTLDIVGFETSAVQPPLTREELDAAIDLAGQELGMTFGPELQGRAMGVTVDDPGHELFGRRLADVRIGNPENRLPRHFATVDLCEGRVIDTGDVS